MYFILIETIFSVILQVGTSPKLIIDKFNHLNLLTCFYFSCKYVYFLFIKKSEINPFGLVVYRTHVSVLTIMTSFKSK